MITDQKSHHQDDVLCIMSLGISRNSTRQFCEENQHPVRMMLNLSYSFRSLER